jgi:hypothetical protein
MKIRYTIYLFIFVALLMVAGCNRGGLPSPVATQASIPGTNTPEPAAPESTEKIGGADAYPGPTKFVYLSPTLPSYPVPRSGTDMYTPVPFNVPEPSAGTGVVVGQMMDSNTGEPMKFYHIYLGKRIYMTPGPGYTYALQEKSSPHAQSDENGRFAIGDVPPGSYLLMIFTPHSVSVVMEPNTDREKDIVVEAGKTLELGEVEAVPPKY